MAHQSLKLIPGVDTTKTLTLNEAAISVSQLIRFAIDRSGLGLVQKLGGWTRFFPTAMPAVVRALWAWQDTNAQKWLVAGCGESATVGVGSPVIMISEGESDAVTPKVRQDDVAVDVSTTSGTDTVDIADAGSSATRFDAVFIPAHISVGGIVIFGFYQCIPVSAGVFQVLLKDQLGNPVYATATVANGGAVAEFTTAAGEASVNVKLVNHGYQVGDTYPVLIETLVDDVTLYGNYTVDTVVDADNFTILAGSAASGVDVVSINGGEARYNFYLGAGPLPTGVGYGAGGYGVGGYGSGATPVAPSGNFIETNDWTFDNFGETLIACPVDTTFGARDADSRIGGPLYYWSPIRHNPSLQPIADGPVANAGAFVAMPQRQIIAYGSTVNGIQDPLLLRWCEVGNFFNWVPSPTTRAGSWRISTGSRIVSALQMGQQGIVLTDISVWSMQYTGGQGVYSINEIGTGCGLIARKAVAALQGTLYWMGPNQFTKMGGGGITPMVCPVWDVVFQNLDTDNVDKIRVAVNSAFNEIAWYYPSINGGGEVDSYVKYNTMMPEGAGWDYGTLARTAWINQSVLGPPIGADGNRLIVQHETSNDADGQVLAASFQTGYFVLNEADLLIFVDEIWPDMKWGQYGSSPDAQVMLTFYVKEYPNGPEDVFGPFEMSAAIQYITPRFRGRLVSIKFENLDLGTFWRMGNLRYRGAPDGKYL